jgi:predicted Zn-dependent protease with MMP-like domain
MQPRDRQRFDRIVGQVIEQLPIEVQNMLEEVPLHVEDRPSRELCAELNLAPDELCGLYRGLSLMDRSVNDMPTLPDHVTIYREGITALAMQDDGSVDLHLLTDEIRITILHEIGHHFGMDEDELSSLGYG